MLGAGVEGSLKWTGTQRLTYRKDGLSAITFRTTFEKGDKVQGKPGGNYKDSKGGAGGGGVGVDLVAVQDRDVFVVRVTGVQGRLDPGTLDAIVASMRLKASR